MGDIMLATPLIRCLKKKYPDSRIDFLVRKNFVQVLAGNPYIDNLLVYESDFFHIVKKIKAAGYDYIINIHCSFLSNLICLFSGSKVLRYKDYFIHRFLLVEFGLNLYREKIPVFKRYMSAARRIGVEYDGQGLDFFLPNSVAESLHGESGEKYMGICPVAVWNTKRWPSENFVGLAKLAAEKRSARVLIFGGKKDYDYCENIRKEIDGDTINLCGIDINESAAYLKKCKILVTNDTGLMHVARALKIPVAALFGPTVEEFGFFPEGADVKIFQKKLSCRPCSTKGSKKCPLGTFLCMKGISVEEVFQYCASYL